VRATASVDDQVREELDIPDPEDENEARQKVEAAKHEVTYQNSEGKSTGL
jgi:hypothetical protein